MTTLLSESSFSQDAPVNAGRRAAAVVPVGRVSNSATGDSHEEWQSRLRSLQQLICELLVKNQRLRWALMEIEELDLRKTEGRKP
jgi:hypothetical protein